MRFRQLFHLPVRYNILVRTRLEFKEFARNRTIKL